MSKKFKVNLEEMAEYIPDGFTSMPELNVENFYNKISSKMKRNQYYVAQTIPAEITNTYILNQYISKLKNLGLNIGKDDGAEFGFKMPLPKKGDEKRELIIFKRK